MEIKIDGRTLRLVEGDITSLETDAIVNAANQYLQLGSGVAGAIRTHGGPIIQKECDEIGYCAVGDAVMTSGGNLKARYVIHAVGPQGNDTDADEKLISATRASLELADYNHLKSIGFPAISTGVFGYPVDRCAHFMVATIIEYLRRPDTGLQLVVLALYGPKTFAAFRDELEQQAGSQA